MDRLIIWKIKTGGGRGDRGRGGGRSSEKLAAVHKGLGRAGCSTGTGRASGSKCRCGKGGVRWGRGGAGRSESCQAAFQKPPGVASCRPGLVDGRGGKPVKRLTSPDPAALSAPCPCLPASGLASCSPVHQTSRSDGCKQDPRFSEDLSLANAGLKTVRRCFSGPLTFSRASKTPGEDQLPKPACPASPLLKVHPVGCVC